MLAIRMQRRGRKGHAMFRVVVQDSRSAPTSGRTVAVLGSYDPHAKTVTLDKEKAQTYLNNGAQPSERIVTLFKKEGVKLPKWVAEPAKKSGNTRNPEKLRSKQEPVAENPAPAAEAESPAEEASKEEVKS